MHNSLCLPYSSIFLNFIESIIDSLPSDSKSGVVYSYISVHGSIKYYTKVSPGREPGRPPGQRVTYDRGPTTRYQQAVHIFTDKAPWSPTLRAQKTNLVFAFILSGDIQRHTIPPICDICSKQQLRSSHGKASPLSNPLLHHPVYL